MTSFDHEPEFRHLSWDELQRPFIDGEFTVEQGSHVHDRPEWQVWVYFGQHKFDEATQRLQFLREQGGLYHYRDTRDGQFYSVPVIERVKTFFKDQRLAQVHNLASRKNWKLAWGFWGATLVALFLAGMASHPTQNPDLANVIGMTFIILFIVGGIVLATAQSAAKRRPLPLPQHEMFFTDVEIEQQQARARQQEAIAMFAVAAYAAHKYHQHSQEHLADLIAERQGHGRGLYGSEWHQ